MRSLSRAGIAGRALVLAPLVFGVSLPAASAATSSDTTTCRSLASPVYQALRAGSTASLITPWASEVTSAKAYGFLSSKVIAKAATRPAQGLIGVSRLYNPKTSDFTWASDSNAIAALVKAGYVNQGTNFYAAASPLSCTVPYVSLTKGSSHRIAAGPDAAALRAAGWSVDATAFHAVPQASTTPETGAPTPTPPPVTQPKPTTPAPTPGQDTTPPKGTETPTPLPGDPSDADGKFSIAVYPDTQMEVMRAADGRLAGRNTFVAAQQDARDIRYVVQVGDLVCWDSASAAKPSNHVQYDRASAAMSVLEKADIPWAGAIGNHDTYAVGPTGGNARLGISTNVALRDTKTYNAYFGVQRFSDVAGTFEAGKIDNSYRTFKAAGKKWMVLSLELWPRPAALDWAASVVAAKKDYNVIVVTHSYLDAGGSISTSNGGYGATAPITVYKKLVQPNPNVKVVLSGHVGTTATRVDTGAAGNKIVSLLTTYHSPTSNPIRFLEFDVNSGSVTSDIYAPATKQTFAGKSTISGLTWVG